MSGNMDKKEKLKLLQDKVAGCKKCKLCETRTQTVFGYGNINAKIVFCAEAPGQTEDKQGIPLCGRAGQLFNNIITACGWVREEVYTCNILKCRPPSNRTPTKEECFNCHPYLDLQLKIISPKYMVCLGATAAQNLLETETPIGYLRGKWHNYKGIKVLASYHPAFLLRNPAAKEQSWADLQLLLKEIENDTR